MVKVDDELVLTMDIERLASIVGIAEEDFIKECIALARPLLGRFRSHDVAVAIVYYLLRQRFNYPYNKYAHKLSKSGVKFNPRRINEVLALINNGRDRINEVISMLSRYMEAKGLSDGIALERARDLLMRHWRRIVNFSNNTLAAALAVAVLNAGLIEAGAFFNVKNLSRIKDALTRMGIR